MTIIKAKRGRDRGGEWWLKMTEGKGGRNGRTSRSFGIKAGGEIPVHSLPDPTHPPVLWEEEAVSKHTWQLCYPSSWGKAKKNKTKKQWLHPFAKKICSQSKTKDKRQQGRKGGEKNPGRSAHCVKTRITIATLAEEEGRIPERWRENIQRVRGEAKWGGREKMKCNKSKLNGAEETQLCGPEQTLVLRLLESKVLAAPQVFNVPRNKPT